MKKTYWSESLKIISILLTIWFIVSFLLSIVFVDALDRIRIGGFKLGFWMAQQGSLYVFVLLVVVYIYLMAKLDRKYGLHEQGLPRQDDKAGDK